MGQALYRRLDAFMNGFLERVEPSMAKTIAEATERLRASGVLQNVPKVGDRAPDFELTDQHGRRIGLYERLKAGPVVLTFFRGGWCPFCSLWLRALDEVRRDLRTSGGDILAISPETAERTRETAERNDISFSLLTDPGNKVARRYGLVWELGPELQDVYGRLGHVLPRINGTGDWTLPVPAGFVIARDGRITYAHADPDLTRRLEPGEAVEAVRQTRDEPSSAAEGPPAVPAA